MNSLHELLFKALWEQQSDIALQTEYRFDGVRKWRFDFAHVESKTAIEIEGKPWGGRHTRGAGFIKDCAKYFAANAQGWLVIRLIPAMVTPHSVETVKSIIAKRAACKK